jgi:hypothetical protein
MSKWDELFWKAWVLFVSSVPIVLVTLVMYGVGRIRTRTLLAILVVEVILASTALGVLPGELWWAWMVFVFSLPFVLMAILMRLVGRIGTRALFAILVAEVLLGTLAVGLLKGLGIPR